jgi:acetyl esterase/lipase
MFWDYDGLISSSCKIFKLDCLQRHLKDIQVSSENAIEQPVKRAGKRLFYGEDPNQFGELRLPEGVGPFKAVINIHGGFWRAKYNLEHAGHLCSALSDNGFATWNLEYRRVGNQGGGWPGTLEDILAAYQYLLQNAENMRIDPNHILVSGHSAGGQLALCLAAYDQRVKVVMSLAGVVDLRAAWEMHLSDDAVVNFLGGKPDEVPERYKALDPINLEIKAKQWLIHGMDDEDVPVKLSRDYANAKTSEVVHLIEIDHADHYDLINPDSFCFNLILQAVREALEK